MDETGAPHHLPFPEAAIDPPNGAAQIQALAEQAAARLGPMASALIATEQSRTNASMGLMTTPDQVTVNVPSTNCLVLVSYIADFKESLVNTGVPRLNINGTAVIGVYGTIGVTANTYATIRTGIDPETGRPSLVFSPALAADQYPITELAISPATTGPWTIGVEFQTLSGATVTVRNRALRARVVPF